MLRCASLLLFNVALLLRFDTTYCILRFYFCTHATTNPPSHPRTHQAFNVASEVGISEWLSGRMELPPGAIKDSEHVALSTQIYVVAEGQPNALELAIAMPSKKASRSRLVIIEFHACFFFSCASMLRTDSHSRVFNCTVLCCVCFFLFGLCCLRSAANEDNVL